MAQGPFLFQDRQKAHGLLEPAVSQELADQTLTRVQEFVLAVVGRVFALHDRQGGHRPGLNFEQGGGHQDEVASDLQIQFAALLPGAYEDHKLVGDAGQGDVTDVEFVFADQEQQQVQRAAKTVDADRQTEVRGLGRIGGSDGVGVGHGAGMLTVVSETQPGTPDTPKSA